MVYLNENADEICEKFRQAETRISSLTGRSASEFESRIRGERRAKSEERRRNGGSRALPVGFHAKILFCRVFRREWNRLDRKINRREADSRFVTDPSEK
jgi:hypothetical protein